MQKGHPRTQLAEDLASGGGTDQMAWTSPRHEGDPGLTSEAQRSDCDYRRADRSNSGETKAGFYLG
jgi:hypothetical protein